MNPPPTPHLYELVFLFGLKKIKKNTNGGTFIIVVCFHEDSPFYIRDVEFDNGSNVKKKLRGVALAICKSYLDKNVQKVNGRPM